MENKISIEKITAFLTAADKIIKTRNPEFRGEGNAAAGSEKLRSIKEAMGLISGLIPETKRAAFNNALGSCNRYCCTYCDLKKHLRSFKGTKSDLSDTANPD